jgi:hypothetical protein
MGGQWKFFVPKQLPTLNDHVVNFGSTRWRYARERDEWVSLLRGARDTHRISIADSGLPVKRSLTVTRVYRKRQRELDYVNMVGGAKACLDAFVAVGLLYDDAPKYLEDRYEQRRMGAGESDGTWFELADVESAQQGAV